MSSPSLYASYVYERSNKSMIETDKGFATFYYVQDACYIEDIFVKREHRKEGIAAQMADQITVKAKENGYKKLIGSVDTQANNCTTSLKVLLAYGFELAFNQGNMIFLKKDI